MHQTNRWLGWATILLGLFGSVFAQNDDKPPTKRFGLSANLRTYPQTMPRETLASVLKAVDERRIDYLLAHLADPQFVDQRVREQGGNFDEVVRETTAKLNEDPTAVAELRRFLKEGDWKDEDTKASASLKEIPTRRVYMKKIDNRWFLENRRRPEKSE
jgi:hypothetical protein